MPSIPARRTRPAENVVIAWTRPQPRARGLARVLGGRAVFLEWAVGPGSAPALVVGLLRDVLATARVVRTLGAGSVVVCQSPPFFAPLVARLAARRGVRVVADTHAGTFNGGLGGRLAGAALRRCSLVTVTNAGVLAGVDLGATPTLVVHDPLDPAGVHDGEGGGDGLHDGEGGGGTSVVCPAGELDDDLAAAVRGAAVDLAADGLRVVVTEADPQDVAWSEAGVEAVAGPAGGALLARAGAMLVLGRSEDSMQRGVYDALERGVPLVCADTAPVRAACGDAAHYVAAAATDAAPDAAPDAAAIAAAVRAARADPRPDEQERARAAMAEGVDAFVARVTRPA